MMPQNILQMPVMNYLKRTNPHPADPIRDIAVICVMAEHFILLAANILSWAMIFILFP
jgi:hypothetical protein